MASPWHVVASDLLKIWPAPPYRSILARPSWLGGQPLCPIGGERRRDIENAQQRGASERGSQHVASIFANVRHRILHADILFRRHGGYFAFNHRPAFQKTPWRGPFPAGSTNLDMISGPCASLEEGVKAEQSPFAGSVEEVMLRQLAFVIITAQPYMNKGKQLRDIKGKHGAPFGETIMQNATEGTIKETTYWWPRPGSDEPFEKATFYTKVGDQICGVGYYKE
jgi:hypothetical protein